MSDQGRARRVAEQIQVLVAGLLERRVKDPRLGFVTITEVRVTGDLQHASVFYTVLGDEAARKSSAAALGSALGMIRSQVGQSLGLRLTPTLEFIPDALPESAAALEKALADAKQADAELASRAAAAQYAGESDPYRKPRSEDDPDPDPAPAPDLPPDQTVAG